MAYRLGCYVSNKFNMNAVIESVKVFIEVMPALLDPTGNKCSDLID